MPARRLLLALELALQAKLVTLPGSIAALLANVVAVVNGAVVVGNGTAEDDMLEAPPDGWRCSSGQPRWELVAAAAAAAMCDGIVVWWFWLPSSLLCWRAAAADRFG